MLVFFRFIHILIGSFFIICLGFLYYSAFREELTDWAYFSLLAIILEGLILILNKGKCPFTSYQKKLGDTKGFFDLFLPPAVLPFVVPVFTSLTILAVILIYLKHFR